MREQQNYGREVSRADKAALTVFGLQWPEDTDQAQWLSGFNTTVALGSTDTHIATNTHLRDEIMEARVEVIDAFTNLNSSVRNSLKRSSNNVDPISSHRIIDAMRGLYANRHRLDILKLANKAARVLLISPHDIDDRLDLFEALKLDPNKLAPYALSYPKHTFAQKVQSLGDVTFPDGSGLDPIRTLNAEPGLIKTGKGNKGGKKSTFTEQMQERVNSIDRLGIASKSTVAAQPSLLKYRPAHVRSTLLLAEAALRYWGADEPRAQAIKLFEEYPGLPSNSRHKLRTLIRIGSAMVSDIQPDELKGREVRPIATLKIDAVLAGYLEWRYNGQPWTPTLYGVSEKLPELSDWRKLSRLYSEELPHLLKSTIDTYPQDEIVQFYKSR